MKFMWIMHEFRKKIFNTGEGFNVDACNNVIMGLSRGNFRQIMNEKKNK